MKTAYVLFSYSEFEPQKSSNVFLFRFVLSHLSGGFWLKSLQSHEAPVQHSSTSQIASLFQNMQYYHHLRRPIWRVICGIHHLAALPLLRKQVMVTCCYLLTVTAAWIAGLRENALASNTDAGVLNIILLLLYCISIWHTKDWLAQYLEYGVKWLRLSDKCLVQTTDLLMSISYLSAGWIGFSGWESSITLQLMKKQDQQAKHK